MNNFTFTYSSSSVRSAVVRRALWDSVVKLDPRHQLRNPVMFTVLGWQRCHDAAALSSD